MKSFLYKLCIVLLIFLSSMGMAFSQTNTGFERDLVLEEENGFVLCKMSTNPRFDIKVTDISVSGIFEEGSFEVDYGDGTPVVTELQSGFTLSHRYSKRGEYTLVFSATTTGGVKVRKEYSVMMMGLPEFVLARENSHVKCLGKDITFLVTDFEENSSTCVYTIDFDDGTPFTVLTQAEMQAIGGKLVHNYQYSYCLDEHPGSSREKFNVHLEARNAACPSATESIVSELMVEPLKAEFTFDHMGANCTYEKIYLRNETKGGKTPNCTEGDIYWEWSFGNGETSEERDPVITYEEAKNYEIKLKVTNGYDCAADSTTKVTELIAGVGAEYSILPDDTLCEGETLTFMNASWGAEQYYTWTITPEPGKPMPSIINGSSSTMNPKIRFDTYGRYQVSLKVNNGCSESSQDTVITVLKDPEITRFELPDNICPSSLNLYQYVGYSWNDNPVEPQWTITQASGSGGFTYLNATNDTSAYPEIDFIKPGSYTLKLELKSIGCGGTSLTQTKTIKVVDPAIKLDISTSDTSICEGAQIQYTSSSTGDEITYDWKVSPSANTSFAVGDQTSASPAIQFKKYGNYTVSLNLKNICGERDTTFKVRVKKEPTIQSLTLKSAVCPGDIMNIRNHINYDFWNNPEKASWIITPSTGIEFMNGTDLNSAYPEIKFTTPGTYQFTVTLETIGCPAPGTVKTKSQTVKVRNSSMSLQMSAADTATCEGGELNFSMTASAAEDDPIIYFWSVEPLSPNGDYQFSARHGNTNAISSIQFDHWGYYNVKGEASGFCGTLDSTIRIKTMKDPEVRLSNDTLCPGIVDFSEYVEYKWYNNDPKTSWQVARSAAPAGDGFVYEGGTDDQSVYPQVHFQKKGEYTVKATVFSAGCEEEYLNSQVTFMIYDTLITIDAGPPADKQDICEGDVVAFRNMSMGEYITYHWEVAGIADGYEFVAGTDEDSQAPQIQFNHYGEYDVSLIVTGSCTEKRETYRIKVRGIPEVNLVGAIDPLCITDALVDMKDHIVYTDYKDCDVDYRWEVSPSLGADFVSGYGKDTEFPQINFTGSGNYTVTLKLASQCLSTSFQSFSSEVKIASDVLKSIFTVDSAVCVPSDISLNNRSVGDLLTYEWEIVPQTAGKSWSFIHPSEDTTRSPEIRIDDPDFYDVKLSVQNVCGSDDSTFRIRTYSVPELDVSAVSDVCEPYYFSAKEDIRITDNNDPVRRARWTMLVDGNRSSFNSTSLYPDVVFHAGEFEVKVEYWNRCANPGVAQFTLSVDEFIAINPIPDTAVCSLTGPFLLSATPVGGSWASASGKVSEQAGQYYFNPQFDPYYEGDIEVIYNFRNGACLAKDTVKVHINPLPRVDAGVDLEMCINHDPYFLKNQDPTGGYWIYEGTKLTDDYFTPEQSGDQKIAYYYTDNKQCTNVDSIVMTVHPLPVTTFTMDLMPCRYADVEIVPDQPANTFVWDFGDATQESGTGKIIHSYQQYGYHDIQAVVTSVHGCIETSEVVRIEVINQPPAAFFGAETVSSCPPFFAVIDVDRDVYADDHNYLSFAWDYGDGIKTDTLGPIEPKFFQSSAWDTTYHTQFTVSNKCGTTTWDTLFLVHSTPKADFVMQHKWECSPVDVLLQNISTGSRSEYSWNMGDGTRIDGVHSPSHEFVTGNKASTYYISLTVTNPCATDMIVKPLLVKPRSISAHFSPDQSYACVGEELCFKNNSTDTSLVVDNVYWNFGDGGRDTLWNACYVYQVAGDYTVSLYIDNGCGYDTVSDRIKVYPLPQLSIESPDDLCEDDTLSLIIQSDLELKKIDWDLGDGTVATNDSVRHLYEGYGKKTISAVGISMHFPACRSEVSKEIEIYNKPIVTIHPVDTAHCTPFYYQPDVTVVEENFFLWDYGDGMDLTSSGVHQYENDSDTVQTYDVLTYVETQRGCKSEYRQKVTVYNLPRAAMEKVVTKGKPETIQLINHSELHSNNIWYLPDGNVIYSFENQEVEIDREGLYEFKLIAENYYQCYDTAILEHEVIFKGLFFPNTFIPHSLNEKVNRFNGQGLGISEYHIQVYDQYGNQVWESRELKDGRPIGGWDGKNPNGKLMPQGVYMWRARAVFKDDDVWTGKNNDSGVSQTVQGSVLLLRE